MDMTSESLRLKAELITMKTISKLLQRAEPVLTTASELLLSTLAWSETYLWYLEISVEELESHLAKVGQAATPPKTHWSDYID
jgi:hypothetical protein